jgi:hypothetical protein
VWCGVVWRGVVPRCHRLGFATNSNNALVHRYRVGSFDAHHNRFRKGASGRAGARL